MTVKIHPLYITFSFLLIYFGKFEECLIYFLVLLLHEMSHFITARMFGYKLTNMMFMPYGIGIGGQNILFQNKHEICIALAGPLFNFLLAIVTVALWWIYPITYHYTQFFVQVNLVLGVFNLLPFYPLDGGRVLHACLKNRRVAHYVEKGERVFTMITAIILLCVFGYSIFHVINFSLLFIALFLIASIGRFQKENINFRLLKEVEHTPKVKETMYIYKETKIKEMTKYLRTDKYYHFIIVDEHMTPIKEITQDQLIELTRQK